MAQPPGHAEAIPDNLHSSVIDDLSNTNNYEEVGFIGSGAYGTVFKARDLVNDGMVALKKIGVNIGGDGVPISLLREIAVLKQLQRFDHPNVVKLIDVCHGRSFESERKFILFLVFEHVEQDLYAYLQKCPPTGLCFDKIKDMMRQILTGLDFLHSNNVVHRDLKPANILVTSSGQVKIADFGLARFYLQAQTLTLVVVTLWYRAPEVLLQSSYATAVDIWSCGCIFAELVNRRALFAGRSENDQLYKIFSWIGAPSPLEWPRDVSINLNNFENLKRRDLRLIMPDICPAGQDLFEKMLIFNPKNRISARQALAHEFFTGIRN